MSVAGPAVLLMAPEGFGGPELERALGSEPLAELRAALRAAAEAWARTVAPDAVHHAEAGEPLADAVSRVFGVHDGPLLVAWPLLPKFRRGHAAGALDDLEAGCDVVLGPVIDGGLYLLGLARPVPALLSLADAGWQDPDIMTSALPPRELRASKSACFAPSARCGHLGDVRAALADPLLPEDVRRILR